MNKNTFLFLIAFIYAASVATEPLAHDHYEEDHAEENCLICHFYEVSSLEENQEINKDVLFNKEFRVLLEDSYQLTYSFPYLTRAPPRI